MSTAERVSDTVESSLAQLGLRLDDVSVTRAGRSRVVRVLVDDDLSGVSDETTPVPPITLDRVADATRAVDDALESSDVMGAEPYTLEVSSPGVDRPLSDWARLRRNVGRLVELTGRVAGESGEPGDEKIVIGRIVSVSREAATLSVAPMPAKKGAKPKKGGPVDMVFPIDHIKDARVQVEFGRDDEPADDDPEDDAEHADEQDQQHTENEEN